MKASNYNSLIQTDQVDILYRKGIHIGSRKYNGYSIMLFQIESFYVEVFYHLDQGAITEVKAFDELEQLEPYLEKMDISSIISQQ